MGEITKACVAVLAAALWSAGAGSALADDAPAASISRLKQSGALVHLTRAGTPRLIGAPRGGALPLGQAPADRSPEGLARAALGEYGRMFGIANAESQLRTLRVESRDGRAMARFQQLHDGVPVIGGELVVNMRGQSVTSINGESAPRLSVATEPVIDAEGARTTAQGATAKWHRLDAYSLQASEPELSIYVPALIGPGDGRGRLVWRTEVKHASLPVRELVLVDAKSGGIALHFNQVDTVRNRKTYTANNTGDLTGTLVCTESDPTCAAGDVDAKAAHRYAGDTYDFYFSHHSRDSIDNAGMVLRSVVHFDDGTTCPNAFWNGTQMTYCDGLAADDVVAHELTHGVTEHTSGLFYYYQSGAINESLSDVWGEFVDLANGAGSDAEGDRWLMGEDVPAEYFGGPLRSMANPTLYGDPDKMTSGNYYTSHLDSGGVHTNSGVNNKAVYLMVDGGTFNGRTVTGIGIAKVAAIYYRVQTRLLTSGSDYADLYAALQQACSDLVDGVDHITAEDCTQVELAAQAVEMDQEPVAGFNPEADQCDAGTPGLLFQDDLESTGNWGVTGGQWYFLDEYATSGTRSLWGYDRVTYTDSSVQMLDGVTLPANAYLWFRHVFAFDTDFVTHYDGGVLEYSANGGPWTAVTAEMIDDGKGFGGNISMDWGNPLGGRAAFIDLSHGFVSTRVNLSSLEGSTVKFRWRVGTDSEYYGLGWIIDDVQIHTCTTPPAAPSGVTATAAGATAINLAWSDNSGDESGFRIYRSTGGAYSAVGTTAANATSYRDGGLTANTEYDYYVVAFNAAESEASGIATATTAADAVKPTVIAVSPANGATGVLTNRVVSATFSELMNCATVTTTTFKLKNPAGTALAGTVKCSGKVATFTPKVALSTGTRYTASISTGARDKANNALAVTKSWSFTTSGATTKDTTRPTVTSVTPAANADDVVLKPTVTAVFSENLDCATVSGTTFKLTLGGVLVPGTVSCSGKVAKFVPKNLLTADRLYTATITTGVKDLARNALAASKVWSFSTGAPVTLSAAPAEAGVSATEGEGGGGALGWFGFALLGLLVRRRV